MTRSCTSTTPSDGWQRIATRPDDNSAYSTVYSAVYAYGLRGGSDNIVLRSRDTTGTGTFDLTAFDLIDGFDPACLLPRAGGRTGGVGDLSTMALRNRSGGLLGRRPFDSGA